MKRQGKKPSHLQLPSFNWHPAGYFVCHGGKFAFASSDVFIPRHIPLYRFLRSYSSTELVIPFVETSKVICLETRIGRSENVRDLFPKLKSKIFPQVNSSTLLEIIKRHGFLDVQQSAYLRPSIWKTRNFETLKNLIVKTAEWCQKLSLIFSLWWWTFLSRLILKDLCEKFTRETRPVLSPL